MRLFVKDICDDVQETLNRAKKEFEKTKKMRKQISEQNHESRQSSMVVYEDHLKQVSLFNKEIKEFCSQASQSVKLLIQRFFSIMKESNKKEGNFWGKIDV